MRGKVIALLLFLPLITPILGDDWIQDSWVDGEVPDVGALWNDNPRSFFFSEDLAWWRYVVDLGSGDNHIFPYAPSDNSDDVGEFGDGIENMREITCEINYFDYDSETFYQVIGGRANNGRTAIYYSDNFGVSWTKNPDPDFRGTIMGVAQRPGTNELHLVANVDAGGGRLDIYILDGLNGTLDQHAQIPGATFTHAHFLFDDADHGYLTISDIAQTHARLWLWDGNDWITDGNKFPGDPFHLYAIWRMGQADDLFVAVDNNVGNDLLYHSADDGDSWSEWMVDYYGGAVDAPQFASTGLSTSWTDTYVYLATSNAHGSPLVCRINYLDPSNYSRFDLGYTGLTEVHDILVADDGIVFISGIGTDGAGLWISDDDGLSWTGNYFYDPWDTLDTVPVLFQDPRFGFLYVSGNSTTLDVPFIVFMAYPTAEIESLPYDCGTGSVFNFINIPVDLPENSDLKVYLRSDDTPQMDGEWVLIDDYNNLKGIEQGVQYVQYKLEFFEGNDVPYSFPVVESFRLNYNPEGDPGGPRVEETIPPDGAQDVPLNTKIRVVFDRSMDFDSFEENFFIYDGEIEIPWTGRLEGDDESIFVAEPEPDLPPLKLIEVLLYEGITDSDGNPLEDDNGPAEGAYDFSFETGGEGDYDDEPPEVTDIKANPNPTFGADEVTLECTADDTEHGGSLIAGGEYFIDDAGLDGEGKSMTAADGDLDDSLEELLAIVDTSGWAMGSVHVLYVHAVDAAGNWSPLQTIVVETEGEFLDPGRVYVWPNPATDTANFVFTVGGDARVRLTVYDLAGREVYREKGDFSTGLPGSFVWDLTGVASDVYIFRIVAEEIGGMERYAYVVKKLAVVR